MFFLGIDIAKLNHVASLVSDNGNIVFSNFMFKNSLEGFLSLIEKVKSIPKDDIVIALEFTRHYSDNFVNFFFNKKFNVTLVNPANVANFRKSYGRDSKNDRIDSINIAKMLLSREYSLVTQSDIEYLSLKKLNRIRDSLVKQKSKCKILLTRNLDSIFPELQYLLPSGIHSKAVYALLKKYPSSEKIAALGIDVLTNIFKICLTIFISYYFIFSIIPLSFPWLSEFLQTLLFLPFQVYKQASNTVSFQFPFPINFYYLKLH